MISNDLELGERRDGAQNTGFINQSWLLYKLPANKTFRSKNGTVFKNTSMKTFFYKNHKNRQIVIAV